jgi:3-methyladenine DNA glycosylase AlkD
MINVLRQEFEAASNSEKAAQQKAYLKNQFEFYGISMPERKRLVKAYYDEYGVPENGIELAKTMFLLPQREFHYTAQELLMKVKKQWEFHHIEDIEWFITTNSWWDTVDHLASNVAGAFFKKWPEAKKEVILNWNRSENMWLIRSSIIFQLKYKNEVNEELLEMCILPHTQDKEFFIRKAIGWALRQYSRFNPDWVRDFIGRVALQPLSLGEAKKYL